jgi:hypothetical protein
MTLEEIAKEIRLLCDTDSTNYADEDLLRRFNAAQETFGAKIIDVVGKVQFDDRNWTDLPVGTLDLSEGVSKYTISDRFLSYDRFSIKDADGNWQPLTNIDPRDYRGMEIEEDFPATGLPTHIDKLENTIWLYPAPVAASVTLTAGLKFRFMRTTYTVSSAELTTGTLVPGIASPWHITLCKMAALPYCKAYKKDRVPQLERDIFVETQDALKYYSRRDITESPRMTMRRVVHR